MTTPRPHDERRYERRVPVAVAAPFVLFWLFKLATETPELRVQYLMSAILVSLFATLWVAVARLLWRAWWARASANGAPTDGPALLLALALAALPDDRREWAAAMTAELTHLPGRRARWWFAAGGIRVALFAPGVGSRWRGAAVPGLVASMGLAAGLLLASRAALRSAGGLEAGVAPYLFLGAPALILVATAIAGARGRTFAAAVPAAVWTVALGALLMFAVGTVEASRWSELHGRLIFDGERNHPPGRIPDSFAWGLLVLPLWWLPFGVLGAALGHRLRRRSVPAGP
jgi:hypothetical protein